MFKLKVLPVVGAMLATLAFLAWVKPVLAVEPGLIRTYEYNKVYWVDRFGISHYVPDTTTQRLFFGDSAVTEVPWSDFVNLPKGGPITNMYPPELYNTAKTRVVVSTVPSAPVVEEQRTVTRLDTGFGAAPIVTERRVEVVQQPTVLEKRVEVVPPQAVEQHVEVVQRPTVERRVTTVTTPPIVERRFEVQTSPTVVERRVETVAAPVVEKTVTTETVPSQTVVERTVEVK